MHQIQSLYLDTNTSFLFKEIRSIIVMAIKDVRKQNVLVSGATTWFPIVVFLKTKQNKKYNISITITAYGCLQSDL